MFIPTLVTFMALIRLFINSHKMLAVKLNLKDSEDFFDSRVTILNGIFLSIVMYFYTLYNPKAG